MSSAAARDVVITGLGVVSPIGIGIDPFWRAMQDGTSGVKTIPAFAEAGMPIPFGGWIEDFDGKQYVTPRKTLKVMSREIQTAFAAARMAVDHAGLAIPAVDPDRWGVVVGSEMFYGPPTELVDPFRESIVDGQFQFDRFGTVAMSQIFPLWMLKYLPNMPASHIGISLDARGPTNCVVLGEASSLTAFIEACRTIERGTADVMVTGGTGSRLMQVNYVFRDCRAFSHRSDTPSAAARPFDADRDGMVNGEGAAMLVLESRRHAEARRANILCTVRSYSSRCEPRSDCRPPQGAAIRSSLEQCLLTAGRTAGEIGHVNAHGLSDPDHDRVEARAIRAILGDVPVTAPKSFFGNLGAGGGAVELIASVLAIQHGEVPVTLNYERPDADCPINIVAGTPLRGQKPSALSLNQTSTGQAVAVLLEG